MQKNDVVIKISDPSQISEARRTLVRLCQKLAFNETAASNVAIVATEIGTNLIKHAGGGEILVGLIEDPEQPCIQIISVDKGKGCEDPAKCLVDGYSTAGSPGTGLGAIKRLSVDFDFYGAPNGGTILYSLIASGRNYSSTGLDARAITLPKPTETESGDNWLIREFSGSTVLVVADGLGHGPDAARASLTAMEVLRRSTSDQPDEILLAIHNAMKSTRGGAVSVVRILKNENKISVAGLGNISSVLVSPTSHQTLMTMNGTAGVVCSRIKLYDYTPPANALLVLHSDGIGSRWDLKSYPRIWNSHTGVVAGLLYRDFRRVSDDSTAVVVRLRKFD